MRCALAFHRSLDSFTVTLQILSAPTAWVTKLSACTCTDENEFIARVIVSLEDMTVAGDIIAAAILVADNRLPANYSVRVELSQEELRTLGFLPGQHCHDGQH